MKNSIIIAHYKDNLNWVCNLKTPYLVVSKTIEDSKNFVPFNKGQEVPMFLKFIIEHYDKLADYTLFLHDHLNSPHQDYDTVFLENNLNWKLGSYYSVNKREWYQTIDKYSEVEPDGINWVRDNWYIFQPFLEKPDQLKFYSGAQFVIHKDLILQYEKAYYSYLYDWIEKTYLPDYITSRIFEYMWHYLFTKNPIEKEIAKVIL